MNPTAPDTSLFNKHPPMLLLVGVAQVAAALGITAQAVHYQVKRGTCPVMPIGRIGKKRFRLCFDSAAVEKLSAQNNGLSK
jgi:hypothetical protein